MIDRLKRAKAAKKQRVAGAEINLSYYPPDQLPKVTQSELRAIVKKPELSATDIETIRYESDRSLQKKGYFRNSDRADSNTRERSADDTQMIVSPLLVKLETDGAAIRGGRHRAGEKTGKQRRASGEAVKQEVLRDYARLIGSGKSPHDVAAIISRKISLSSSQIRKILATDRKARTS